MQVGTHLGEMRHIRLTVVLLLLACGDGGNSPTNPPTPPTPPSPVATSITLSATSLSFSSLGATQQLTATVKDQIGVTMNGASVSWSSSSTGVATVSSSGLVTAVANGTATITATSGTLTAAATVSVSVSGPAYPAVIRGLWEPGAWDQLATFVSDPAGVDRLKSLGINTVSVVASFDVLENGEYQFQHGRLEMVQEEVMRYKGLGFAVLLSGNANGVPTVGDPQTRLDNYLLSYRAAAIQLAELGELYQVDYFSPANEFEGTLANEGFPAALQSPNPPETVFDPPDAGTDARVELASKWFRDLLPDIQPLFSGRLIAKVGSAHSGYRVDGYDYLGFTIDHNYLDQTDFRRLIKIQYGQIAEAASASNVSWMVGEAYFHHSEPGLDLDQATVDFLRGMQEHYFNISLDEYVNFNGSPSPCGYVFIGYFMDGIEVKDSPSEPVIKGHFENMVTSADACSPD